MLKSVETSASSPEEEPSELLPETIVITDVLDLHGTPLSIIPQMIDDFINNAVELGLERVQIIHGKGKSRLKYITYQQLTRHPAVVSIHDALPDSGGWGRSIVWLKSEGET